MNSKTLISVIVPVYKVEQYLDECVQSIIHQTYTNLEIILVDDGSPDHCPEMCDEYAKQDSRIKVIHKKNGGLSSARNAGLDIATGEYIGFVDSDDWIAQEMYERMLDVILSDENIAAVSFQAMQYYEGTSEPFVFERWSANSSRELDAQTFLEYIILDKVNITCWSKLYRRSIISSIRFLKGRNNEDFLFNFFLSKKILNTNYYIQEQNEYVYYYRYNEAGIKYNNNKPLEIDSVKNCLIVINECRAIKDTFEYYAKCRYVNAASGAYYHFYNISAWRRTYLEDLSKIIVDNRNKMNVVLNRVGIRHKVMFYIIWYCPILWRIPFVRIFCTAKGSAIACI